MADSSEMSSGQRHWFLNPKEKVKRIEEREVGSSCWRGSFLSEMRKRVEEERGLELMISVSSSVGKIPSK